MIPSSSTQPSSTPSTLTKPSTKPSISAEPSEPPSWISAETICCTLPPTSTISRVDVFLLFDDTGSFAGFVSSTVSIFRDLISELGTALPDIDFGYGVGRFEDYNCCGGGSSDQAFVLNQPIVTSADASAASTDLTTLIETALGNSAPGGGADGPETAIEALFQIATGAGFDRNGDGNTTGSPIGTRLAGTYVTQRTTTGYNGDIPGKIASTDGYQSNTMTTYSLPRFFLLVLFHVVGASRWIDFYVP